VLPRGAAGRQAGVEPVEDPHAGVPGRPRGVRQRAGLADDDALVIQAQPGGVLERQAADARAGADHDGHPGVQVTAGIGAERLGGIGGADDEDDLHPRQRLGNVGDGWNVSLTTLMNERMSIGARLATGFPELFEFCSNLMLEDGLAIDDRNVRAKLASWAVKASGLKYTSYRAISALSRGERPGPENSIGKLVAGSMLQDIAAYAMDLEGAAGALTGASEEVTRGQFQQMLLSSPSMRIAGGTDEILRNIIAERVLGLPAEPRVDKDVPWKDLPR